MTAANSGRYNPPRMSYPLYLPVENQVRELDAKVLFACVAAARGFPTVLGFKPYLYFAMPQLEPGIFIAKSMRAGSALMFDIIAGLGHLLVAWDEESLVRYISPEYTSWRYSAATFRPLRHLFAWGPDDAEMFRGYAGNPGVAVHETGNPRIDLLRRDLRPYFAADAAALRDRYGDFVLVNTNFSFVNPFLATQALVLAADARGRQRQSRTAAGMSAEFAAGMAAHQQQIFDHFRELVPQIGRRFPERTVVIRPHPSENHEVWRALVHGQRNVAIVHEGNVIPWLMAASVLLHNGCTTAVEAAVLERPAVSYRPVQSPVYDYLLPNSLSHEAFTAEDALTALDEVLGGRRGLIESGARDALFARHLTGVSGDLSSSRIVDVLDNYRHDDARRPRPTLWRRARARAVAAARTGLKYINMRRRQHWASARYHEHIYPEIALADIDARIRRFDALVGGFDGLASRRLSRFLFRIERR